MPSMSRGDALELSKIKFGTIHGIDIYIDRFVTTDGRGLISRDAADDKIFCYSGKKKGVMAMLRRLLRLSRVGHEIYGKNLGEAKKIHADAVLMHTGVRKAIEHYHSSNGVKLWEHGKVFEHVIQNHQLWALGTVKENEKYLSDVKDAMEGIYPERAPTSPVDVEAQEKPCITPVIHFANAPLEKGFQPGNMMEFWNFNREGGPEGYSVSFDGMDAVSIKLWNVIGCLANVPHVVRIKRNLTDSERSHASPALLAVTGFIEKYNLLSEEWRKCKELISKELDDEDVRRAIYPCDLPCIERKTIDIIERARPISGDNSFRRIARCQPKNS